MLKHMLSYTPGHLIPAALSLLNLAILTHHLSVNDYGIYALIVTISLGLNAFFGQALLGAIMRFYTASQKENSQEHLLASCGTILVTSTFIIISIEIILFLTLDSQLSNYLLPIAIINFLPLTLQQLVLRVHMAALNSNHYSIVSIVQSCASSIAMALLIILVDPNPIFAILGITIGSLTPLAIDYKITLQLLNFHQSRRSYISKIIQFSWATSISQGLSLLARRLNIFILFGMLGASSSGILNATLSLAEQALSMVFMLVAMAAQPLTVKTQETDGPKRLTLQLRQNALWFFGLGLPSTGGLIMICPQLSELFLGEPLRNPATSIMPWIAIASFFNGLRSHYIAHSFFLAHKVHYQIHLAIGALVLSIILNLTLIPLFGLFGAVHAAVCGEAILCVAAYLLAMKKAVPIPLPWKEITLILAATLLMMVLLIPSISISPYILLVWKVGLAVTSYAALVSIFNVNNIRSFIFSKFSKASHIK